MEDEEYGIIIAAMKPFAKILMATKGTHGPEIEEKILNLIEKEHPEIEASFAEHMGQILYS